jgi:streptomycin 3"-adenylyltransferase
MARQCGWDNAPVVVRAQVNELVAGLRAVLGAGLVGVYLHGSLAMGSFTLERSDIDVLAVTAEPLTADERRALATVLLRVSNAPRPIEISVLSRGDLHPWRYPPPYQFHYSEDWRDRTRTALAADDPTAWDSPPEPPTDPDLAAHITVTRARGIVLAGEPIAAVFPLVPPADYRAAIVDDFAWAYARREADPVYFVLNTCRVLATVHDGQVRSKVEGAAWALDTLPTMFHRLIGAALAGQLSLMGRAPLDPATVDRFAAYAAAALGVALPSGVSG